MNIQPRATKFTGESAFQVLARAQEIEAQGRSVIHLEIGQPDFPTPPHICEAAARALREGKTGYGPTLGIPELRRAIAADAGRRRKLAIKPEQVVVTPGAKPILYYAIDALAGEGDEVIYPNPGFPMYASIIHKAGAKPVPLVLREKRAFRFDPDEFRSLLTDRTRMVILNSPQNPTGGLLTRADLLMVADEASRRDLAVLSDEIYSQIQYEGEFVSIASLPGMAERTIIVDGFSKAYSMTGWRLGYGIVPRLLVGVFDRYQVNIVSCAATFSQHAAVAALEGPQEPTKAMVAEFKARRDFLVEGLSRLPGVACLKPGGAFYAFPNIRSSGIGTEDFARMLLDESGVAVLPGTAFGKGGEGYLRISYASSMENLREALARMEEFLLKYRGSKRGVAATPAHAPDAAFGPALKPRAPAPAPRPPPL